MTNFKTLITFLPQYSQHTAMLGSPTLSLAVIELEHLEVFSLDFSINFKDSVMEKAAHIPTKYKTFLNRQHATRAENKFLLLLKNKHSE